MGFTPITGLFPTFSILYLNLLLALLDQRTKASIMHEYGVDVNTISMVLDNTPRTVMNHYIISSNRNYDACDIADCAVNGYIVKTNNLYFNRTYLSNI